jgi:hypothetical protein
MGFSGAMSGLSAHFTAGSSQLMHWRSVRPEMVTTGTNCFPHFGQCVIRSMRSSRFFPSNLELEFLFHSSVSAEGPAGIGAAPPVVFGRSCSPEFPSSPHEPTGRANARPMTGSAIPIASPRTRSRPMGFASAQPILRAPMQFSNSSRSFAVSPRDPREFCRNLPLSETEGAGNAGRSDSARSLACKIKVSIRV